MPNAKQNTVNFAANPGSKYFKPFVSTYDSITDTLAKGMAKCLENKHIENFIKWTSKSENIVAHYSAAESIVLSGFYIQQTLKNDKLDEKKRKTLAINQAGTCVVSAVMSYAADKAINNKISELTNKYLAVNVNTASEKALNNWKAGFSAAKTIMVFGIIYRFIAPVFVTPVANWLGNKLDEKKQADNHQKLNVNA